MTPVSVSWAIIDRRYWILIGLLLCANGSSIELWYWQRLMASGLNYDIGVLRANGSWYWIMILVHFDGARIELWHCLLSAKSLLCIIQCQSWLQVPDPSLAVSLNLSVTWDGGSLQPLAFFLQFLWLSCLIHLRVTSSRSWCIHFHSFSSWKYCVVQTDCRTSYLLWSCGILS